MDRSIISLGSIKRRGVLAAVALLPGAGAALGSQLGDVIGSLTTEIEQAVILHSAEVHAIAGGLGNVDTDGTRFRTSGQISQGDLYAIHLILGNRSDGERLHRLTVDGLPPGLTVEAFPDDPSGVDVQQVDDTDWLVEIKPSTESTLPDNEQVLELVLDTEAQFETGVTTIEGHLRSQEYGGGDR